MYEAAEACTFLGVGFARCGGACAPYVGGQCEEYPTDESALECGFGGQCGFWVRLGPVPEEQDGWDGSCGSSNPSQNVSDCTGLNDQCVECPAGQYATGSGNAECTPCGVGKYSTVVGSATESDCTDCIAGKYVEVTGSDEETD